ncbi:MAG: GNAT family N-acetyltransferase [Acetobacteraceae bacterium]|nr:GNAT family N-acetyltransferase [Acetobacteraceae bacterium]
MLEGKSVRLRPVEPEDAAALHRWGQDWEVQRLGSGGPDVVPARPMAYYREWIKALAGKKDAHAFMIVERDGGRAVGFIQLRNVDQRDRCCELSIEIGEKDCWGKGYGREAVRLALGLAFEELGLNRVGAACHEFNPRAIRCFEAAGFRREGVYRAALFRDGRFWADVQLSILAGEYFSQKATRGRDSGQTPQEAPPAGGECLQVLEGELVRLRPLKAEDAATFYRWGQDWEVQRLSTGGARLAVGDSQAACLEWIEGLKDRRDLYAFMVLEKATGRPLGTAQLASVDLRNRRCDLGIEIGEKDFWGRGYGRDAVRVLLRLAFEEVGLNRVAAGCYSLNPRAIRCFEALGFKREAVHRAALFRDGRFWTDVRFSITAEEYFALRRSGTADASA